MLHLSRFTKPCHHRRHSGASILPVVFGLGLASILSLSAPRLAMATLQESKNFRLQADKDAIRAHLATQVSCANHGHTVSCSDPGPRTIYRSPSEVLIEEMGTEFGPLRLTAACTSQGDLIIYGKEKNIRQKHKITGIACP